MDSTFDSNAHIRGEEWRVENFEGTPVIQFGTDQRWTVFFQNWQQFERFVKYAECVMNEVKDHTPEAPTT